MSSDNQEIREWRAAVERVWALVESVSPEAMETTVPATPDWTARDLLSHMVGYNADALAGDEPDDHNPDWTQAQVEKRRDRSPADLVAEWRGLAGDLEAWMEENGARPLGDVIIHEQDLRSALEVPGARDTEGFALIRDRMAKRFADALPDDLPDGGIALVGDTWSFGPDDAPTRVRASDFDLGRAVVARRTAEQLREWTEAGDVTPYLDAFAGLGPLPEQPLPE